MKLSPNPRFSVVSSNVAANGIGPCGCRLESFVILHAGFNAGSNVLRNQHLVSRLACAMSQTGAEQTALHDNGSCGVHRL